MKEYMIGIIREHWYFEPGSLETMDEADVKEIFERLIDWLE